MGPAVDKPTLTDVNFITLDSYGKDKLAKALMSDQADTSYASKEQLEQRILTDEKIKGFVVQFSFGEKIVDAGFVLYDSTCNKLTDMYTFAQGRGQFLFNRIVGYFRENMKWEKVEVIQDKNNLNVMGFFNTAIGKPWSPLKDVVKK